MDNFENTIPQYKTPYTHKDHEIDTLKQQQIKIFDKISSKIYSLNPDLMYVLPQGLNFYHIVTSVSIIGNHQLQAKL